MTSIRLLLTAALASAVASVLLACSGTAHHGHGVTTARTPVLGSKPAYSVTAGFEAIRPANISFGGDGTSGVSSITWESWGGPMALGNGVGVWVWPGTCSGCNKGSHARVVAFALGSCHGHLGYTRLEWYFPEYDEKFEASRGTPICPHAGAGTLPVSSPPPVPTQCPPALVKDGDAATEVSAEGISCPRATELLHRVPAGPFEHERRFEIDGFRCGTEGAPSGTAVLSCGLGHEYVTFSLPVR
jgi:hypothetical protein